MPMYRVPAVIKDCAIVRLADGSGAGDYVGGLPRDAEAEVRSAPLYLCTARMAEYPAGSSGQALQVDEV